MGDKCKMMGFCDISADFEGSVEFTQKFTSIEEPFLIFDATKGNGEFKEKIGMAEKGDNNILYHCVDHLPAEMPKEASNHFGLKLYPFVEQVAKSDFNTTFEHQVKILPKEIATAIICANGRLTPRF